MTPDQLHQLFDQHQTHAIDWDGHCHDCGTPVFVSVELGENGFNVSGGAVYWPDNMVNEDGDPVFFLKCDGCFGNDSVLRNWNPTEVYDRTVGYYRPVKNMNKAKRAEQRDRKRYSIVSFQRL